MFVDKVRPDSYTNLGVDQGCSKRDIVDLAALGQSSDVFTAEVCFDNDGADPAKQFILDDLMYRGALKLWNHCST